MNALLAKFLVAAGWLWWGLRNERKRRHPRRVKVLLADWQADISGPGDEA